MIMRSKYEENEVTEYKAITAVWEITMACNMRCMHCGSSCTDALPDELTTAEAYEVCDDMGRLGVQWVTLSGGEPLTRKDWPLLAKRLKKNGVTPNMITNAWLIDEETVLQMKESGIGTVAISLDGLEETHDKIRREGSFKKNMAAFELLKKHGQYAGAITSINKANLAELPKIKETLVNAGVDSWQLQICIPMGNMKEHSDELVGPEDIDTILEFCLETAKEGEITIYPADCLGYYTEAEELIRYHSFGKADGASWSGCNAGKRGFGVLQNGDVLGCTSIRDTSYIEGNVKERSLYEIWNDESSFSWSRSMTKDGLKGTCSKCVYADTCLGGCPNVRLTMNGTMESDNPYCSYNYAMNNLKERIDNHTDYELLFSKATEYAESGNLQEAEMIIEKLLEVEPENIEYLALSGFIHFFLGAYDKSKMANEQILEKDENHFYANKGLGLSLHRLGFSLRGITYIEKAIKNAPAGYMDPYYDLATVYIEMGKHEQANEILRRI